MLLRGWSARAQRPYEHGIEGPYVIARRGWYYLFYSGDSCCSFPPHYAVLVARSRSATGPFERFRSRTPSGSSVMVHSNKRFAGPGHVSVIKDEAGTDWLFHHAIDATRPYLPDGDQAVRRPVLIERLVYRHGWPHVATNSPAVGCRNAPVTR